MIESLKHPNSLQGSPGSQAVRKPGCGTRGPGFESRYGRSMFFKLKLVLTIEC